MNASPGPSTRAYCVWFDGVAVEALDIRLRVRLSPTCFAKHGPGQAAHAKQCDLVLAHSRGVKA